MYILHDPRAGIAVGQWLALRLQMISAGLVTLVALLAILDHQDLLPAMGRKKHR